MLRANDVAFLENVRKYRDETNFTSRPTHAGVKSTLPGGSQASINFIVPVKLPTYFYDVDAPVDQGDVILTKDEFIDALPNVLHEHLSHAGLSQAITVMCETMEGKERFIKTEANGLFISSARLVILIVDETGDELGELE